MNVNVSVCITVSVVASSNNLKSILYVNQQLIMYAHCLFFLGICSGHTRDSYWNTP